MSEVPNIFDPKEADNIKAVEKSLNSFDETRMRVVKNILDQNKALKENAITFDNIKKAQDGAKKSGEDLNKLEKELIRSKEKLEQADKEITKQIIKNRTETQKRIKTIKDELKAEDAQENSKIKLQQRNKELREEISRLDLTDQANIKTIREKNAAINRNNEIINSNSDKITQLKNNVGNYKEEISEALDEQEFFGVSLSKIKTSITSAVGIVAGITAAIIGLGKAYASSARGAEDLARASDRLDSIVKTLGNSLADLSGESGFFDSIIKGLQTRFLGLASTIRSDVEVSIRSTIRQLEILEIDQERQKKAQLDRAEVLRQIRDEERNSFEERKRANDELGQIINKREEETVAFQEKRLANFLILLSLDEENIELQKQIKQIEFEIADAREEAQGFRSEQLVNDLALSKEFATNQIELQKLIIEGEIAANDNRIDLRQKLIDKTLELELKAAGENQQLQQIALQNAKNAEIELFNSAEQEKGQVLLESLIKQEKAIADSQKKEEDILGESFSEYEKGLDDEVQAYVDAEVEKTEKLKNETEERKEIEENRLKIAEEYAEKQKEIDQALKDAKFDLAAQGVDALFTLNDFRFQKELADLEKEKQLILSNENLTAKERERIEEEFARKQSEIQAKQAKNEKIQALFSVAINTAIGASKAIAASPATFGLPFLPFVIAQGAIQAALIAGQPIPEFAKGTENAPERGIMGEVGRELFFTKSGQVGLAEKPTYFDGKEFKGMKIIPNKETEQILSSTGHSGFSVKQMTDDRIVAKLDSIDKNLKRKNTVKETQIKTIGFPLSNYQMRILERDRKHV